MFRWPQSVRSKSRTWADGATLWLVQGRVKKRAVAVAVRLSQRALGFADSAEPKGESVVHRPR